MRIAIVGLGKIGQPLAALYASRGHDVVGADIDLRVVDAINAGRATVVNEPGLAEMVAEVVSAGRLRATGDTAAAVAAAEVVLVAAPMLIDAERRLDYRMMDAAFERIAVGLRPGTLVIIETTLPVGDTRRRFGAQLSQKTGQELRLAFSPERVQSGRIFRDLATYPKVVGGIDAASGERAARFYEDALGVTVIRLSSSEAAEFCKLAESVYRDVNIGLANELALAAERYGLDISEIIPAANSEPQSHLHAPGIGVGGHCMPVYPYFLLSSQEPGSEGAFPITAAGRETNERMPAHAAEQLDAALGGLRGRTVLILGLAYRAGVKEAAHSPATALAEILRDRGAQALVHDPLFSDAEIRTLGLEPASLMAPDADALVLQTFHPQYRDLDLGRFPHCRVVLDGRNALDPVAVREAGMVYLGIGRSGHVPEVTPGSA
jgi:nucleotide sugar dehydrogenase